MLPSERVIECEDVEAISKVRGDAPIRCMGDLPVPRTVGDTLCGKQPEISSEPPSPHLRKDPHLLPLFLQPLKEFEGLPPHARGTLLGLCEEPDLGNARDAHPSSLPNPSEGYAVAFLKREPYFIHSKVEEVHSGIDDILYMTDVFSLTWQAQQRRRRTRTSYPPSSTCDRRPGLASMRGSSRESPSMT